MASFTIWEHSHLSHLLGEAWIHPACFAFLSSGLCSGKSSALNVLQSPPCNGSMTSFRNWLQWREGCCQGQPRLLRQGSPRVTVLVCSQHVPLNPSSQKSVILLKRLRIFQETAPWRGHVGMPGSWPKSWSEFITWSAAKEASTLMVGLWPWVLDVRCLEVLSSLLSYLLAFTSLVGLHFLNLPCSFSALSLYLENVPPLLLPYTLRLSPRKSLSWPQRLLEYSSFSTLYMSTLWCSSLWPSQPGSLSISPTGKWLSWSWDCVVCSWL